MVIWEECGYFSLFLKVVDHSKIVILVGMGKLLLALKGVITFKGVVAVVGHLTSALGWSAKTKIKGIRRVVDYPKQITRVVDYSFKGKEK